MQKLFGAHKNRNAAESLYFMMYTKSCFSQKKKKAEKGNSSLLSIFLNRSNIAGVKELEILLLTTTVK